ncbi:MAG TPA: hypothetical protein DEB17_01085 [Chlorobaculum sp.]|uniref:Uncharacterized protein n=1 Tax=Chlorobaculum tepidum (strain ATCC 49652 / DSM 12025 / NBRC 103806 / TLS) TaxID=194439 RepID=Q8KCA7_CHLTE|nr:hypothetical protein CT1517 [Chlorobaculum tepidum TLS]HBU22593.1 hypothetical protein [Chlorobaculum sp.]
MVSNERISTILAIKNGGSFQRALTAGFRPDYQSLLALCDGEEGRNLSFFYQIKTE